MKAKCSDAPPVSASYPIPTIPIASPHLLLHIGPMERGFLIALEGIDGAGTTTQRELLAKALAERGLSVHETMEPSRGPIGQFIRTILTGELTMDDASLALLFAADRLDHLKRDIEPALEAGKIVISDRYLLSSLAYQGSTLPRSWVSQLNDRARHADLTILLRVTAQTANARRKARGLADERFDAATIQERIACEYDHLVETSAQPIEVIDGNRSLEAVAASILASVESLLQSSRETS
ncbi:MAG: dTMP kinase [Myxococcota bacterium]